MRGGKGEVPERRGPGSHMEDDLTDVNLEEVFASLQWYRFIIFLHIRLQTGQAIGSQCAEHKMATAINRCLYQGSYQDVKLRYSSIENRTG